MKKLSTLALACGFLFPLIGKTEPTTMHLGSRENGISCLDYYSLLEPTDFEGVRQKLENSCNCGDGSKYSKNVCNLEQPLGYCSFQEEMSGKELKVVMTMTGAPVEMDWTNNLLPLTKKELLETCDHIGGTFSDVRPKF